MNRPVTPAQCGTAPFECGFRSLRKLAWVVPLWLCGCGYVHFGRIAPSDAALRQAYSDLALRHKILRQELVIARGEEDALRTALERARAGESGASSDVIHQLEKTTTELATLRARVATLQQEKAGRADAAGEQATVALRNENTRLRQQLDAAHRENAALAGRLKQTLDRAGEAQASLQRADVELNEQTEARRRAEMALVALRSQLDAVMARAAPAQPASGTEVSPQTAASVVVNSPLAALQQAKSPPSGSVPSVEIRTTLAQARAVAAAAAEASIPASPQPAATTGVERPRAGSSALDTPPTSSAATHPYVVQAGDTLESIAVRLYGEPSEWTKIYALNVETLSAGGGLKPGMTLVVPSRR